MRGIILSLIMFFLLAQCTEPGIENAPAELLIGAWENTTTGIIIEIGPNNNFSTIFGPKFKPSMKYEVADSKNNNQLIIYDSVVTYQCKYSFLENDKLKLVMGCTEAPSEYISTSIFQRLR